MSSTQKELDEAKRNISRTFYILLLAFIAWPLGLFFRPLISLLIFAVLVLLWAVSAYISFMHYLSAKNKID